MLQRLLFSGIFSGLITGVFLTFAHMIILQPLILQAESYEKSKDHLVSSIHHEHPNGSVQSQVVEEKKPKNGTNAGKLSRKNWYFENFFSSRGGLERVFYSFGANILTCIAFGVLLVSGFTIYGKPINLAEGVLWGVAGFLIFSFLPGLGLPPELPGSAAGDLAERQIWWLGTVISGIVGFTLLAFGKIMAWRVGSVVFFMCPHLIGAPQPEKGLVGSFPPELAAHFVMMTLCVAAVIWLILSISATLFYARLSR